MHEHICDKLDISSEYLNEIIEIVSKTNDKACKIGYNKRKDIGIC